MWYGYGSNGLIFECVPVRGVLRCACFICAMITEYRL